MTAKLHEALKKGFEEGGPRVVATINRLPTLPLTRLVEHSLHKGGFGISDTARASMMLSESTVYTLGAFACSFLSLAPIENSPTSSSTVIPESTAQSNLHPNTITENQFNTNPEIQNAVAENAKTFTNKIKTFLGPDAANVETISFPEVVKVDDEGMVSASPYSFDFNDQLQGPNGEPVNYFSKNSLIAIKNKGSENVDLYFYSTFANSQGETSWSKDGKSASPLNKVTPEYDAETNTLRLYIHTYQGGEQLQKTQIVEISNAYDVAGNLTGDWKGINHATGAKLEPVVDGLIGAVGVKNITVDADGKVINNVNDFGDPAISPPPTPGVSDIAYHPKVSGETQAPETPVTEIPAATITPEATEVAIDWPTILPNFENLKIEKGVDGITRATNPFGQVVEITDKSGVLLDFLNIKLNQEPGNINVNKIDTPEVALKVAKLNALPFPEGVQACKKGDVKYETKTASGTPLGFSYLKWSDALKKQFLKDPKSTPGIILGNFFTPSGDQEYWGKIVQWNTPDGPIFSFSINNKIYYTKYNLDRSELLPIGKMTREVIPGDDTKHIEIVTDPNINALLDVWEENGCPPANIQDHFILGYPRIK